MPRPIRGLLPALTVLAVAVAGCGGGDDNTNANAAPSGSGSTQASAASTPAQSPAKAVKAIAGGISHKLSQRPRIPAPQGQPPQQLVVKDIVKGSGKPVRPGETVTVQYVGASWSNGQEFDASWNRGQPFRFQVPGQVIEGWNEGVLGMRKGGRRLLVIPPAKGYGATGTQDGSIRPNETLAFVIDLEKAK
jgi:peptidylprolyl isomerase